MILWSESLKKKIQESLDSPKKCIFDLLSQDIDTEEELGLRKEMRETVQGAPSKVIVNFCVNGLPDQLNALRFRDDDPKTQGSHMPSWQPGLECKISENFHYITILRNPVSRYLSEWRHVQRGATWKASLHVCDGRPPTSEELPSCYTGDDWSGCPLKEFMDCPYNLANNRQVRMLSDLTLVGCYNLSVMPEKQRNKVLLESAKSNLKHMAFFGLTEFQRKTQYLFEKTFNMNFISPFTQYNTTRASSVEINEELQKRIEGLNFLDMELYSYAKDLFLQRSTEFAFITSSSWLSSGSDPPRDNRRDWDEDQEDCSNNMEVDVTVFISIEIKKMRLEKKLPVGRIQQVLPDKLRSVTTDRSSLKSSDTNLFDGTVPSNKSSFSRGDERRHEAAVAPLAVSSTRPEKRESRVSTSSQEQKATNVRQTYDDGAATRLMSTVKPLRELAPSEDVIDIKPEPDDLIDEDLNFVQENPLSQKKITVTVTYGSSRPSIEIYRPPATRNTDGGAHVNRLQFQQQQTVFMLPSSLMFRAAGCMKQDACVSQKCLTA
ncbi:hypothetical protein JEQ12_020379 [Ovis aries]|uniref:Heparan-sulfate 6-O-sulfotransferase n=1 Tax=Ovis aries TaxID=9940 RepID=A0A836CQN4_SHEEP|nr:hypothetical protein JEQ12_020379 [Ovis aries]